MKIRIAKKVQKRIGCCPEIYRVSTHRSSFERHLQADRRRLRKCGFPARQPFHSIVWFNFKSWLSYLSESRQRTMESIRIMASIQ